MPFEDMNMMQKFGLVILGANDPSVIPRFMAQEQQQQEFELKKQEYERKLQEKQALMNYAQTAKIPEELRGLAQFAPEKVLEFQLQQADPLRALQMKRENAAIAKAYWDIDKDKKAEAARQNFLAELAGGGVPQASSSQQIPSLTQQMQPAYNQSMLAADKMQNRYSPNPMPLGSFAQPQMPQSTPPQLQQFAQQPMSIPQASPLQQAGRQLTPQQKAYLSLAASDPQYMDEAVKALYPDSNSVTPHTDIGKILADKNAGLLTEEQANKLLNTPSKEQAELDAAMKAENIKLETAKEDLSGFNNRVDELLNIMGVKYDEKGNPVLPKDVKGMGGISQFTKFFEASNAGRMDALLASIVSDKTIDTIMEMKSASKTGATGFGALNKEELNILKDSKGKLSVGVDPDITAKNLIEIKRRANRVFNIIQKSTPNIYDYEPVK